MAKMRALVLLEPRRMELQDVEIPTIEPDEILVRVGACGTCATDLKIYRGEQSWVGKAPPFLFGHEVVGIVQNKGSEVTNVDTGEQVLLRITHTGYAQYCKTKAHNAIKLQGHGGGG